jgi:hypothetical protein
MRTDFQGLYEKACCEFVSVHGGDERAKETARASGSSRFGILRC